MEQRYTISRLAREYGISRSTLLYYEKLGLIAPASRTPAGYRHYGSRETGRLATLCAYREAGLSLEAIRRLLDGPESAQTGVFRQRLDDINREIARLREQQALLVRLLENDDVLKETRVMNKARWMSMLRQAGADEAMMARWHAAFEAQAPEAHQDFLESLGLGDEEVAEIRDRSRCPE